MEQTIRRKLDERYEITRQVSTCGETIIYLGRDIVSGQLVTIKEFFAETIMQRDAAGRAEVLPSCEVQYKSLSSDYEELCNYLMQLPSDFPILRPIEIIWRNNTVYAIEKYSENETFDDYMARRGHALSWNQLKFMITPIIKLLGRLHADGVYHRGISPETLLVNADGALILSGFCIPAARTAESEIDSTLYFGYSAPEQYSSNSWQGSWSDVYSLASVCYRALTGITPVEWRQRGKGRALAVPIDLVPEIPQNVSDALVQALTVDLRSRYRTVEEFWCALLVAPGQGTMTYQLPLPIQKRTDELMVPAPRGSNVRPLLLALALISLVAIFSLALAYRLVDTYFQPLASSSQPAEEEPSQEDLEPSQTEIVVPNLVGTDVQKVLLDPLYQRLFTFQIERIFSESQPAGAIVAQQPKSGEDPGDSAQIYLWVSKGSELIPMPNVQGKTLAEATVELNHSEISYTVELIEPDEEHQDAEDGTVLNTSIPAGNIVYRNTDTVIIYVAQVVEQPEEEESSSSWDEEYVYSVPPRTETYWPPNSRTSGSSTDDED
ncbi:serine/threonine protein kinase [Oscillospiraceae bacterium LTW-04]|nr:PASTA domain-containing protein [Oscillospiraceae bacterium MB24-C1]